MESLEADDDFFGEFMDAVGECYVKELILRRKLNAAVETATADERERNTKYDEIGEQLGEKRIVALDKMKKKFIRELVKRMCDYD
jgi:hypothetical protein